ncbi:hypothetical protein H8E50_07420, partial [bacterium]|nr:hypothetical protein [bacterium]
EIPLSARIFAVVDVWDALSSDRPYRLAWSREKVIEHITSISGTHFDPDVIEVFLRLIDQDYPVGKSEIRKADNAIISS